MLKRVFVLSVALMLNSSLPALSVGVDDFNYGGLSGGIFGGLTGGPPGALLGGGGRHPDVVPGFYVREVPLTPWQDFNSGGSTAGAAGAQWRSTDETGAQAWQDFTPDANGGSAPRAMPGQTFRTGRQIRNAGDFAGSALPLTMTTQYGLGPGTTVHINQLPPTSLSSFVLDSGKDDDVYGHEGEEDNTSWAPIEKGLDSGNPDLTTGHRDPRLPSLNGEEY